MTAQTAVLAPLPLRQLRALSFASVLALHGGALAAALAWATATLPTPPEPPKVLSVSLLTAEVPPPEVRPPAPPPPALPRPPRPRPLIAAARAEPVPDAIVAPPPPAEPEPAAEAVAAYAPAEAAPPAPSAPVPPSYDMAYLRNPAPAYPAISKKLREEGTVVLRVLVSETGEPISVDIAQSSGFARLDEAARRAVLRWRFTPSRQGDTPIRGVASVPLLFSLKNG